MGTQGTLVLCAALQCSVAGRSTVSMLSFPHVGCTSLLGGVVTLLLLRLQLVLTSVCEPPLYAVQTYVGS